MPYLSKEAGFITTTTKKKSERKKDGKEVIIK
jgi:hypothetical protein